MDLKPIHRSGCVSFHAISTADGAKKLKSDACTANQRATFESHQLAERPLRPPTPLLRGIATPKKQHG